MRFRTVVALLVVVAGLLAVFGMALTAQSLTVTETWVSDTTRDNRANHHAVGVGPEGSVLAPVAAVVNAERIGPESCVLVRLDAESGAVRWRDPVPESNCTTHALTAPAVGNLDGDSGREVAVGTTEKALVVSDLATGAEAWRLPLETYGYGRPAVANVTDASGPEVIASDIDGNLLVANDGTVQWRATVDGTVWAAPVVAGADGDHVPVVVGSNDEVVAFRRNGTVAWRTPIGASTLSHGDVDADGRPELVTTDGGTVAVLDGDRGTVDHRWNASGTVRVADVTDADGDGDAEVYVGVAGGDVVALDPVESRVEWRTTVSETGRTTPAPRVGDVDGDGTPDVVAVANDGTVAVLEPASGEQRAVYTREMAVWTEPTLADVDDDGGAEVFVRYGDGRVVRLDAGADR